MSDAVTVAYVHQDQVSSSWHHSVVELLAYDLEHEARVARGGWVAIHSGTDGLVESRNLAVRTFLASKEADWLFWTDTDMGYQADTVERLLEVADARNRPVVGGLCFSLRESAPDGHGGYRTEPTPTVFDWMELEGKQGFAVRWEYQRNALVACAGTGSACVLIHRSALARVEAAFGPVWYNRVPNPSTGQLISEDLSFCVRLGALQIPVHVHTGVQASHHKSTWYLEDDYLGRRALARSAAEVPEVPAATEAVAVIVPVQDRRENAKPFMDSLLATTPTSVLVWVHPVLDMGDLESDDAWCRAGAGSSSFAGPGVATWSQKCNLGYRNTEDPWLLFVGDDVKFWPGWLDQAMEVARQTGARVIGTHDGPGGNPRVAAGDHAVHWLIRRDYIDEVGASWDGPGVVCHEGYRVWFQDDEVVQAAKQRGEWAFARHSVIEHLHPLWGKSERPVTIDSEAVTADRQLFQQRLAASRRELASA